MTAPASAAPRIRDFTCPDLTVPDAWLIGAASFLMDRAVPATEQIRYPGRTIQGGAIRVELAGQAGRSTTRLWARRGRWLQPMQKPLDLGRAPVFDMRWTSPQNWSHFLNIHLPFLALICEELGLDRREIEIILPEDTPGYITAVAALFDLRIHLTNAPVDGCQITWTITGDTHAGWYPSRGTWLGYPGFAQVTQALFADRSNLPRRIFLARRGTRAISNPAEIEPVLTRYGFVTLYPEDLPVADQFRLFNEAETILAVHGAGLAPLLYRPPTSRLTTLIEILPCGHMTDFFRVMSHQAGVDWIGIRGRIKPAYLPGSYDLSQEIFARFSLDSFELCPRALETALKMRDIAPVADTV